MSKDYVALLGTSGDAAISPGSSMPSANLICMKGRAIVVDCGLGVTKGLVDQGIHLRNLSMIFITHLHSDHYVELGPLLHTAWTAGLTSHVDVYGPSGLEDYWWGFLDSMQADISGRIAEEGRHNLRTLIRFHVIEEGLLIQRSDLTVAALRAEHPPLRECYSLSFKSDGLHVVFSGDTAPTVELEHFAEGADLLIHEAVLDSALPSLIAKVGHGSSRLMAHYLRAHTFAHDAARTAVRAKVKALALSHLVPADDPSYGEAHWRKAVEGIWDSTLFIGRDGLRIDLPLAQQAPLSEPDSSPKDATNRHRNSPRAELA